MGGNACKKYGVHKLTQKDYEDSIQKIKSIYQLTGYHTAYSMNALKEVFSFPKEIHGDIDFILERQFRDLFEKNLNSDSTIILGSVDNGSIMTSYAIKIDLGKDRRVVAQIDVIWSDSENDAKFKKFFYSWNGFVSYFFNKRLRNLTPNFTLTDSGLFYESKIDGEAYKIPVTESFTRVLELVGLDERFYRWFDSKEQLFKYFNSSRQFRFNEFGKPNTEHELRIVNEYYHYLKSIPAHEIPSFVESKKPDCFDYKFWQRIEIKEKEIRKKIKTENHRKSRVRYDRVKKIDNYLNRKYFNQWSECLTDRQLGSVIEEGLYYVNQVNTLSSRKELDLVLKRKIINIYTNMLKLKELS